MSIIVTHCDIHYLSRSIALIFSLRGTSELREIWVFTHDEEAYRILNSLELQSVKVISSQVLVSSYAELEDCKAKKSNVEFLFALTPFMILYAIELTKSSVWYIDADVYFLKSFGNLERQTKNKSILVSAHNFPPRLRELEKYGKYNVGIIFVLGDQESLNTIQWWSTKCMEDTTIFTKAGVYGDQKYLDEFPKLCLRFGVFAPIDTCAAPWNIEQVEFLPPISFHFSGLRRYRYFYFCGLSIYGIQLGSQYRINLYEPYSRLLEKIERNIFGKRKTDTRKLSRSSLVRMIIFRDLIVRFLD